MNVSCIKSSAAGELPAILPQEGAKPRRIFAAERFEGACIPAAKPLPQLVVVGHVYPHYVIRLVA